ncbi:MAG: radical SAM protein [Bacteroidales bacterium]|nr:radical SAM protein [Bacteroidales bacterium]
MNLKEIWLFLKKLTYIKVCNFICRKFASLKSHIIGKLYIYGKPWSISIEPCNICNLNCKECFSGLNLATRSKGFMSLDNFEIIINQIYETTLNLFLYFQGEPYMNKHFTEMIKYANSKNIYTVTSTNGHFIDYETAKKTVNAGLDKIIISMDGYDQNSYSKYRKNGNFEKVLKSIENLSKAKKDLKKINPIIEIQVLANKYTENHFHEINKLSKKYGGEVFKIKTMQIENENDYEEFLPNKEKLSRYKKDKKGNYLLKNKINFCNRIYNSIIITYDLNVLGCCYDKNANFVLGNLKNENLKEVINNQKTKDFFAMIMNKNKRPKMCNNCGG